MRKLSFVAFAATFALSLALPAGRAGAEQSDGLPKSVARYIDDATLVVARVDAGKLDVDAFVKFVEEIARDVPAEQRAEMVSQVREQMGEAKSHVQPLLDAGVKSAYVVVGPGVMQGQMPLVVIPTEGAEQQSAVESFVAGMGQSSKKVEGAMVVGDANQIKAAESVPAAQRPLFGQGLGNAGDAAVQVAVVPTPLVKMLMTQGLRQQAAQKPELAQFASAMEKLELFTLHLGVPPAVKLHTEMRFADAAAAQQMADASKANMEANMKEAEAAAAADPQMAALLKVMKGAEPKVKGNALVMDLTREQIAEVARAAVNEQAKQQKAQQEQGHQSQGQGQ